MRFLGHRDDVPRLLAAADLLVLPSLYEGLPNVVLEAMRFQKPVVATAAPGTTEVVVDGETGLLVPVGKPVALAQAIRTVLDDPDLAANSARPVGPASQTEFHADHGRALRHSLREANPAKRTKALRDSPNCLSLTTDR